MPGQGVGWIDGRPRRQCGGNEGGMGRKDVSGANISRAIPCTSEHRRIFLLALKKNRLGATYTSSVVLHCSRHLCWKIERTLK